MGDPARNDQAGWDFPSEHSAAPEAEPEPSAEDRAHCTRRCWGPGCRCSGRSPCCTARWGPATDAGAAPDPAGAVRRLVPEIGVGTDPRDRLAARPRRDRAAATVGRAGAGRDGARHGAAGPRGRDPAAADRGPRRGARPAGPWRTHALAVSPATRHMPNPRSVVGSLPVSSKSRPREASMGTRSRSPRTRRSMRARSR